MADLKLTNYDLDITNGDISFVTKGEAIKQDITMRLRTFLGECVYDRSAGVPYLQVVFEKNTPISISEQLIKQTILDTPGVLSITEFTLLNVDPINRSVEYRGFATSINGDIDFSGSLTP